MNKDSSPCGAFAVFQKTTGSPQIAVRFEDDDVWLTQMQLAELYATTKQNVGQRIKAILDSGELSESRTVKKLFTVRPEGNRVVQRPVLHYNLEMIIALGHRIDSPIAVRFRQWDTERLHEYIQKGFALNDELLQFSA